MKAFQHFVRGSINKLEELFKIYCKDFAYFEKAERYIHFLVIQSLMFSNNSTLIKIKHLETFI